MKANKLTAEQAAIYQLASHSALGTAWLKLHTCLYLDNMYFLVDSNSVYQLIQQSSGEDQSLVCSPVSTILEELHMQFICSVLC